MIFQETELAAGIELENTIPNGNNGMFDGIQYFSCEAGRGHFIFLKFCKKDSRFFSSGEELQKISKCGT